MAASAGGLQALRIVLQGLGPRFPAPVAVVQHRTGKHPGLLERVRRPHCLLPLRSARSGEPLRPATVYVAPATEHLLVAPDGATFDLRDGGRISYVLSSAAPLFTSAASASGSRVDGMPRSVVLTGVAQAALPLERIAPFVSHVVAGWFFAFAMRSVSRSCCRRGAARRS